MSRTALVRGAAALVLVAIIVVVLFVLLPRNDSRPKGSPGPSIAAELTGEAAELASLMRNGQEQTYHAVYDAVGPVVPKGGSIKIEVWRKKKLSRVEQTLRVDDRVVTSTLFTLSDRSLACTREGRGAWTCTTHDPSASGGDSGSDPASDIAADLEGKQVASKNGEVDGRKARCFEITEEGQTAQLCVSKDGIPLSLRNGPARQELKDLDDNVPDEVFVPPAGTSSS